MLGSAESRAVTDAARQAVRELVDRETAAWDEQDVETLLDLFHPDMVWAWPPTGYDHDPSTWDLEFGRFDRDRWREEWQTLFSTHELVHNRRSVERVDASDEGDGGLAVVDIDTLWRHRETGEDFHWKGRTAKIYALVDDEWKLTAHWGALRFDEDGVPVVSPPGDADE
jgi:ketosteroid isomerase-like protein